MAHSCRLSVAYKSAAAAAAVAPTPGKSEGGAAWTRQNWVRFVACLATLGAVETSGWVTTNPPTLYIHRTSTLRSNFGLVERRQRHAFFLANSADDDTAADAGANAEKDMEDLIVSLSFESDDAVRRAKLASIFKEKLNGEDHSTTATNGEETTSFANLFNQVLIAVGDRIQLQAAAMAANSKSAPQSPNGDSNSAVDNAAENDLPSFPLPAQQKSSTELQLWALVDMMVQSKTLIRKANGQLGSEGHFG